jgi:hypothetical protein
VTNEKSSRAEVTASSAMVATPSKKKSVRPSRSPLVRTALEH